MICTELKWKRLLMFLHLFCTSKHSKESWKRKRLFFAFPWEIEAENGPNLDQEKGHSFFTSPWIFEVFLLPLRKKEGGQKKRCILIFQVVFPYLNMFALGNKLYDVLMEKYLILAFRIQLTQATARGTRTAVTEERLPGKRTGQGAGRGSRIWLLFRAEI